MIKSRLSRPKSWSPGGVERQPQITSAKHRRRGPRLEGLDGRAADCSHTVGAARHRWAPWLEFWANVCGTRQTTAHVSESLCRFRQPWTLVWMQRCGAELSGSAA